LKFLRHCHGGPTESHVRGRQIHGAGLFWIVVHADQPDLTFGNSSAARHDGRCAPRVDSDPGTQRHFDSHMPAADGWSAYTIQVGDTLTALVLRYNVSDYTILDGKLPGQSYSDAGPGDLPSASACHLKRHAISHRQHRHAHRQGMRPAGRLGGIHHTRRRHPQPAGCLVRHHARGSDGCELPDRYHHLRGTAVVPPLRAGHRRPHPCPAHAARRRYARRPFAHPPARALR